jgi:hypothetical protein
VDFSKLIIDKFVSKDSKADKATTEENIGIPKNNSH